MRKALMVCIIVVIMITSIGVAWSVAGFFAKPENTWDCKIDNSLPCKDGYQQLVCTNALNQTDYTIGGMTCDECPSCQASENA